MDEDLQRLSRRAASDPSSMRAFAQELVRRGLDWDLTPLPHGLSVKDQPPLYEWRPEPGHCVVVHHARAGVRCWVADWLFAQLFRIGPTWVASVHIYNGTIMELTKVCVCGCGNEHTPREPGPIADRVGAGLDAVRDRGIVWAIIDPALLERDDEVIVQAGIRARAFHERGGGVIVTRARTETTLRLVLHGIHVVASSEEAKELILERGRVEDELEER